MNYRITGGQNRARCKSFEQQRRRAAKSPPRAAKSSPCAAIIPLPYMYCEKTCPSSAKGPSVYCAALRCSPLQISAFSPGPICTVIDASLAADVDDDNRDVFTYCTQTITLEHTPLTSAISGSKPLIIRCRIVSHRPSFGVLITDL